MTTRTIPSPPFAKAKWITRRDNPIEKEFLFFKDKPNMTFTKVFDWQGEGDAQLFICGLGYYTAYVNGQRLGDAYLNSDVTNYDKTVYYDQYNLSSYLINGENTLVVELGNGWYNPAPIAILGRYNVRKQLAIGKPCLICDVQLGDKHIYSDQTWQAGYGHLLQNDIYIGEVYSDAVWEDATTGQTVCIAGPAGQLVPSFIPKVKRHDSIFPVQVEKKGSAWLVDFGQIVSGQIAFTLAESYIGEVTLCYAEDVHADGQLDVVSTISGRYGLREDSKGIQPENPVVQTDTVVKTQPSSLSYSNQYTYHSFRYVWIEASGEQWPFEELRAYRVHTAVPVIADFESSSEILNQLWTAGLHTRLHNIHSYFEDCSRERLGYGGDTVGLLQAHLATIDARALFKKVFLDFVHDQRPDGGIPQTAPYVGIMTNGTSNGAGSLGWQLVLPTLAQAIAKDYGDEDFVCQHQKPLQRHVQYLLSFDYDYAKVCCLGDWGSIDETADGLIIQSPDQAFCSAVMYLLNVQLYYELSQWLPDLKDYQTELAERKQQLVSAIQEEFYDSQKEHFASGSASSMIFALKAGLVKDRKAWYQKLLDVIRSRNGIFPFGIFGMSWAYEELANGGDNRLIFDWLTRLESPSYHDMVKGGNQTLAEHFAGEETFLGSKNHAMFSSYSAWMVRELLGIKVSKKRIRISPDTSLPLDWVKGSFQLAQGSIQLEWNSQKLTIRCSKKLADLLEVSAHLPHQIVYIDEEIGE